MGILYLYELLASKKEESEFELFTFDDIDAAFDAITGVRFSQQLASVARSGMYHCLHSETCPMHHANNTVCTQCWPEYDRRDNSKTS